MVAHKSQNTWTLMSLLAAICLMLAVISLGGQTPCKIGLAAKYAGDEGIEKDPNVILFTDFESDEWHKHWSGGRRKTVRVIIEDKERSFEPLQNKALQIKVSKGEHYGASIEYKFKDKTGSEPEEIYFRYYLRFGSDWNPRRGGKLPGRRERMF